MNIRRERGRNEERKNEPEGMEGWKKGEKGD